MIPSSIDLHIFSPQLKRANGSNRGEAVARIAVSPTHKAQFEALYGKILFSEPQQGLWVMSTKGNGVSIN